MKDRGLGPANQGKKHMVPSIVNLLSISPLPRKPNRKQFSLLQVFKNQ